MFDNLLSSTPPTTALKWGVFTKMSLRLKCEEKLSVMDVLDMSQISTRLDVEITGVEKTV